MFVSLSGFRSSDITNYIIKKFLVDCICKIGGADAKQALEEIIQHEEKVEVKSYIISKLSEI